MIPTSNNFDQEDAREEVERERMDDVNPDIERLFRAKKARRAILAGLPFQEKVKAVVRMQEMGPRSCGPEAGTYVCGAFRRWTDEAFQPAAAKLLGEKSGDLAKAMRRTPERGSRAA